MSEWWTYRLSDFLMFTSSTYFRLFERSNREWWVLLIALLVLGIAALAALLPASPLRDRRRLVLPFLGIAWLWVAWEFHWRRYTTINLAAPWFAGAFVLQGLVMMAAGRPNPSHPGRPRLIPWIGLVLAGFGLLLQPFTALLLHRPLAEAQWFGLAPDPTVTVTMGLLLAARAAWPLFLLPLLWCVVTSATLWTLEAPDAGLMLGAGAVTLGALIARRFNPKVEPG